jgi:hypothetical protein
VYLNFKDAGKLPTGAGIAKDSFAVAKNRKFIAGPLFLMEKMPPGFNYLAIHHNCTGWHLGGPNKW